jgi:hypothetical protein
MVIFDILTMQPMSTFSALILILGCAEVKDTTGVAL